MWDRSGKNIPRYDPALAPDNTGPKMSLGMNCCCRPRLKERRHVVASIATGGLIIATDHRARVPTDSHWTDSCMH